MLREAKLVLYIVSIAIGTSCRQTLEGESVIYSNDFETGTINNIVGGKLMTFNGTQVVGNYFNDGFTWTLGDLPEHEYVVISYDLYIHDSWDGNMVEPGGPDWWYMLVEGEPIIETTFSNGICNSLWCLQQSYPQNGWRMNNPKTGAFRDDLPTLCYYSELSNGTTQYRISRTIAHSGSHLEIDFFDKLTQPVPNDICDESWSLDNLVVKVFSVK